MLASCRGGIIPPMTRCAPSVLLLLAALAGCAGYEARPIDPARTEASLRARSLADPGLRAFIERHAAARATAWPPPAWDLEKLTLAALYFHPDLDVARARVRIAEAAVVTAGGRPNPTVAFGPQYTNPTDFGTTPWTAGISFDVPIETAGKRDRRIERAEHDREAACLALEEAAWRVRSRLRAALVDHVVALDEARLFEDEVRLRAELQALAERRLAVGDASALEVHAARSDLAAARLAARAAEGRVAETRAALAQALGLAAPALDGAPLAMADLAAPPALAALPLAAVQRAGLLNRLDVRKGLAEYAAAEAALRLEVAKQYPDLHVGPGYQFDQGQNHYSLGIGLELPILNRNEGPIAEAEARRAEAAALFLALQADAIGEMERTRARYAGALLELAEASRALAAQEARAGAIEREFAVGEEDRLALDLADVELASARRARLEAAGRAQAALGALEDALERPLAGAPPLPEPTPAPPRAEGAERGDGP
jgi:outer membrane protein TolC